MRDTWRAWRDTWGDAPKADALMIAIVVMIAVLFPLVIYATIVSENRWAEFETAHHCRVVGRMTGSLDVTYIAGPNGSMTPVFMMQPDKVGWLCDDGVTYWR